LPEDQLQQDKLVLNESAEFVANDEVELLTTDDQRIKVIGEELANDTGRMILAKISQEVTNPNDLAKTLEISLPLVNWHIKRLLAVGLIKIERTEQSSKNKEMKYYGPMKTAIMIVPLKSDHQKVLRFKSLLARLGDKIVAVFVFVGTTCLTFAAEQLLRGRELSTNTPTGQPIQIAFPYNADFILPLIAGVAAGLLTIGIARYFSKKLKEEKK
jgi:DNA-binding transcriptional ArsR family regulator